MVAPKLNEYAPPLETCCDHDQVEVRLKPCPPDGAGKHRWLAYAATKLHAAGMADADIADILAAECRATGRCDPREIADAIRAAERYVFRRHRTAAAPALTFAATPRPAANPRRPRDPAAIIALLHDGAPAAVDLWERSPVRFEEPAPNEIVTALFPGDPLLCAGIGPHRFRTDHRSALGDLSAWELIVPSPMSARTGRTQDGRESAHTLANTGPRRHLVTEIDLTPTTDPEVFAVIRERDLDLADVCAAILWHLRESAPAPLVAVVHSGGKSLHGWWRTSDVDDDALRDWFAYGTSLGVDPQLWTRSQFARLPDGTRYRKDGTTCPQPTLYFDPR